MADEKTEVGKSLDLKPKASIAVTPQSPEGTSEFLSVEDLAGPPPSLPPGESIEDFIDEQEPMPGARPLTPQSSGTDRIPPFQLPSDEDDPEGHAPAHHTVESEKPKPVDRGGYSEISVEDAQRYLEDARKVAPDLAKTVKSIFNSLVTEGFTAEQAQKFTEIIVEKKLGIYL